MLRSGKTITAKRDLICYLCLASCAIFSLSLSTEFVCTLCVLEAFVASNCVCVAKRALSSHSLYSYRRATCQRNLPIERLEQRKKRPKGDLTTGRSINGSGGAENWAWMSPDTTLAPFHCELNVLVLVSVYTGTILFYPYFGLSLSLSLHRFSS